MAEVEVRRARPDDVDWLLEQVRAFEQFAGYKRKLLEDEAEARVILATIIRQHVVLIAERQGTRMGFVAGYLAAHPFNPRLVVLSEIFWWVPEEWRGSSAGARLLIEFERLGQTMAHWVILSLETKSPVREKHLVSRGFREVERAFLLEV